MIIFLFKNYFGMISVFNYALLINESWRHDDDCLGVMIWKRKVGRVGGIITIQFVFCLINYFIIVNFAK